MLLNERLKFFSISYVGQVTSSSNENFPRVVFFVWGRGSGSLAVIKPDLSRNITISFYVSETLAWWHAMHASDDTIMNISWNWQK